MFDAHLEKHGAHPAKFYRQTSCGGLSRPHPPRPPSISRQVSGRILKRERERIIVLYFHFTYPASIFFYSCSNGDEQGAAAVEGVL